MPRTKRPVKKTEKAIDRGEASEFLKKLDKLAAEQKKRIDDRVQMELRNIDVAFKILVGSISKEQLNMTVGQLKNEMYLKEVTNTRRSRNLTRSGSDDGYNTETSRGSGDRGHRKHMGPPSTRRSRSANTTSSRKQQPPSTVSRSASTQRRLSKSVYRTPAYNKNAAMSYPDITPKVGPHNPLTVLRQPRQGEMVVSLTGSPVIVPSYSTMKPDEMANCNILLRDGTMLSVQPKPIRQSQAFIPFSLMDTTVITQLKTLKDNLDKVLKLGEKDLK